MRAELATEMFGEPCDVEESRLCQKLRVMVRMSSQLSRSGNRANATAL
jgi:hypothetical protein